MIHWLTTYAPATSCQQWVMVWKRKEWECSNTCTRTPWFKSSRRWSQMIRLLTTWMNTICQPWPSQSTQSLGNKTADAQLWPTWTCTRQFLVFLQTSLLVMATMTWSPTTRPLLYRSSPIPSQLESFQLPKPSCALWQHPEKIPLGKKSQAPIRKAPIRKAPVKKQRTRRPTQKLKAPTVTSLTLRANMTQSKPNLSLRWIIASQVAI